MPGKLIVPLRRGRDEANDEDGSEQSSGSEGMSTPSTIRSTASKRNRMGNENDVPPLLMTNGSNHASMSGASRLQSNIETQGTYQPGSIVRVTCTNFVTYTDIEFKLGPSLNMIVGPNGTGKSTLVCAICLGLGWGPQHLGRAKELGEFVKHGTREADIEIELAAGPAQRGRNPVIRRNIKKEGNKSQFYLNGRMVPQKEVNQLARSFAIQIDNLCQFLPQDRVVEFAQLSPILLLESTQRAAAPEHMLEWHNQLKQLHQTMKKEQATQSSDREQLQSLQTRQNASRADFERMQERNELQLRLKALEKARPIVAYNQLRKQDQEAKVKKKEARNELKALEKRVEPTLRSVNAKQVYREDVQKVVNSRRAQLEKAEKRADVLKLKQQTLKEKAEDCDADLDAERKSEKKRKDDISRIQAKIKNLQNLLQQRPPEFDPTKYNQEIRERANKKRGINSRAHEIRQSMDEMKRYLESRKQDKLRSEKELEDLKSQSGQQLSKLKQLSPDTARAYEWVVKNGDKFQGRIYGPPTLECSVKDPRYADLIESVFQRGELTAFTCESQSDFKKLQSYLLGREHLGLSDVSIRSAAKPLEFWQSPVAREDLQRFSLEGWLLDFLEGPAPVLSMLCDSAAIHRTGATLHDHTDAQYERLLNSPIQAWVTKKSQYRVVRRREYGDKAVSTIVRPIRRANIWTDQAVDTGMEQELSSRIQECQVDIAVKLEEFEGLRREQAALLESMTEIQAEIKGIESEKAERQKANSEFQALPTRLANQEEQLKECKNRGDELRGRYDDIIDKIGTLAVERAKAVLEYADSAESLYKHHRDLLDAEIVFIEADSEFQALTSENEEVKVMLDTKRKEVETLEKEATRIRNEAEKYIARLREMREAQSEAEREIIMQLDHNISAEELEGEIESARARIELIYDGNPNAIADYERRQTDIDARQNRLAELNERIENLREEVESIKSKWEPELDALVQQISNAFSYNFEKIGCAGQVGIFKDEDFGEWAIQIQVKFRENEQLSILDSHRQSGGERAVSTIFYLMALQSLARSPFRVVDEINQGMDPRNERMVHERMVDIACQEHTSQYFLITPKLLHGLKYDKKMTVHCIASGEYMPSNSRSIDFQNLANVALRVKGGA